MPSPALIPAIISSLFGSSADLPQAQPQGSAYVAALRSFPAESKKGRLMAPITGDQLEIGGQKMPAAPGLQIRNEENFIVMSSMLQESVPVRYQLDLMGNVWRVWILSAAEQSAPEPKQ